MLSGDALRAVYAQIHQRTTELAGGLEDIPRRAALLHGLYLESGENHTFPLIAAHGALWAYGYFEVGGKLGQLIGRRYFYNSRERAYRLSLLQRFAEGFRKVNRLVFIDTYSNYQFARQYGKEPAASQVIQPDLLRALNRVHAARAAGERLSDPAKKEVFSQSFQWEQELTVAPGVQAAVKEFDCPILVALCLKPWVRFAYFPLWRFLFFHNFADKAERIDKGMRAYDLAARGGWQRVTETLRAYRLLPPTFFQSPLDFVHRLQSAHPA
jgi:hypothetical protein